eukprot:COSAG01_NODE_92_length_27199_cov_100.594649_17_plen_159_part_00
MHVVFIGFFWSPPTISISSPVLTTPRSTFPVTTVPARTRRRRHHHVPRSATIILFTATPSADSEKLRALPRRGERWAGGRGGGGGRHILTAAGDREHVLDRHQERLVQFTLGNGDVLVARLRSELCAGARAVTTSGPTHRYEAVAAVMAQGTCAACSH